jgi:hypothetical protein
MDKDEFQLIETDNNTYVMLVNHKFGSVLSVIDDSTGTKRVRCVPQEQQTDDCVATELNSQESMDDMETGYEDDDMETGYEDEGEGESSQADFPNQKMTARARKMKQMKNKTTMKMMTKVTLPLPAYQ